MNDPAFGRALSEFASDYDNPDKKERFSCTVADFLNEFELYVIDKPKIIHDLIDDIVDKITHGDDVISFRKLHPVADMIMDLHGSDYLDGVMYITFKKSDAMNYLIKEYDEDDLHD